MDEPKIITKTLSHKEVTLALIKHQNIHEGIWQLYIEFAISAGNLPVAEENEENLRLCPAAIVPIKGIGLMMVDKENPLALDASKVNPPVSAPNA
jgi:hypothetical protein